MKTPSLDELSVPLASNVKPLRAKLCDWGILVLLSLLLVYINLNSAHKQCIPGENTKCGDIKDPSLSYPYIKSVLVPFDFLIIYCILPWILVWLLCLISFKLTETNIKWKIVFRKFEMLARMWFATLITTQLVTETLKNTIGRPRPNFYEFKNYNDHESRLSFPSGHASLSFSMLSLLTIHLYYCILYIQNHFFYHHQRYIHITCNNSYSYFGLYFFYQLRNYLILCLLIAFLPVSLAIFIAASRVIDYWHHYSDIIAGSLIGASIAIIVSQSFHFEFYGDGNKGQETFSNKKSQNVDQLLSPALSLYSSPSLSQRHQQNLQKKQVHNRYNNEEYYAKQPLNVISVDDSNDIDNDNNNNNNNNLIAIK